MSSDIYTNTTEDLEPTPIEEPEKYLQIANCLSEFSNDDQKRAARNHLDVYPKESVDNVIEETRRTLEESIELLRSIVRTHTSSTAAHNFPTILNNAIGEAKTELTEYINQVVGSLQGLTNRVVVLENLNIGTQLTTINGRLNDVYTKSQVRLLVANEIERYIEEVIKVFVREEIENHEEKQDPHGTYSRVSENFVAKEDLTTLSHENVPELTNYILEQISKSLSYWQTRGPVEATVGLVPEGTDFEDRKLTLQYIMDRIFYGRGEISLIAPSWVIIYSKADLQILVPGNTDAITKIELYQGGTLIKTFTKNDIVNGKIETQSNQIRVKEVLFEVKMYQSTTEEIVTDEATVRTGTLAFAGIDYWAAFADHNSWEYLQSLVEQGKGIFVGPEPQTSITTYCSAYDINHNPFELFLVMPQSWGSLRSVQTKSQEFSADAFVKKAVTIMTVNGKIETYWVYVFDEKIYRCSNLEVTYNIEQ